MRFELSPLERLHRKVNPDPPLDLSDLGVDPFARPSQPEPEEIDPESPEPAEAEETEPAEMEQIAEEDMKDLPPVVVPPERDMAAEVRALLSPVGQALDLLELDETLREQRDGLLVELASFAERLTTFLAEERVARVKRLTAEHEAAQQACRDQVAVIEAVEREKGGKEAMVRRCQQAASTARALVDGSNASRPNLNNWPDRIQVERWQRENARLTAECEAAENAEGAALSELRAIGRKLGGEQEKLWKLAEAEKALRNRLSGKPFIDSEFGLQRPAEL